MCRKVDSDPQLGCKSRIAVLRARSWGQPVLVVALQIWMLLEQPEASQLHRGKLPVQVTALCFLLTLLRRQRVGDLRSQSAASQCHPGPLNCLQDLVHLLAPYVSQASFPGWLRSATCMGLL